MASWRYGRRLAYSLKRLRLTGHNQESKPAGHTEILFLVGLSATPALHRDTGFFVRLVRRSALRAKPARTGVDSPTSFLLMLLLFSWRLHVFVSRHASTTHSDEAATGGNSPHAYFSCNDAINRQPLVQPSSRSAGVRKSPSISACLSTTLARYLPCPYLLR